MADFEKVAEDLIALSIKTIKHIKTKNEYAETINYQINHLFEQLGEVTKREEGAIIQPSNLHKAMSPSQLNLLYCSQNRKNGYITAEDLCTFLHISKHNLKRCSTVASIDEGAVDKFYSLLDSELQLQEELINCISEIGLQKWFNEVDFFNNGYIDTSTLYEYFLHYDTKQQVFEEYNALLIIRLVKRHSASDKLCIQDFKAFLESANVIQIFLTNDQLTTREAANGGNESRREERHKKNISNDIYSYSSEISIAQIKVGPKLTTDQKYSNFESLGTISRTQIDEQLKQQENITYEERLIRLHSRNQKYIREAKRQMEGIIPICSVQIQSHMQIQASRTGYAELIRKLKHLGDIFNKITILIQSFLSKNLKFTFVNAFALIDVDENNSVNLSRWKDFLKEIDIKISNQKASVFFNEYASKQRMNFSHFLKMFKYSPVQEEYVRCATRYPLIYQGWSEDLIEKFRIFLSKIINLVDERKTIADSLTFQEKDMETLLKPFSFLEQIAKLLGKEQRSFSREYFQERESKIQYYNPKIYIRKQCIITLNDSYEDEFNTFLNTQLQIR